MTAPSGIDYRRLSGGAVMVCGILLPVVCAPVVFALSGLGTARHEGMQALVGLAIVAYYLPPWCAAVLLCNVWQLFWRPSSRIRAFWIGMIPNAVLFVAFFILGSTNDKFLLDHAVHCRPEDVASVYVGLFGQEYVEAATLILAREDGDIRIREVEWGRP